MLYNIKIKPKEMIMKLIGFAMSTATFLAGLGLAQSTTVASLTTIYWGVTGIGAAWLFALFVSVMRDGTRKIR
jgi:hypothetical protein